MNHRTKTDKRVADTHEENPAAVFRRSGGKSPLKGAGELSILEKFRNTDFAGGTVVVYAHGCGFSIECWRNIIGSFFIEGNKLAITSEKCLWTHDDISQLRIREENGVFNLSGPSFPDCAIAPDGVEIPKKETLVEAIKDSEMLLTEGMGEARGGRTEKAAEPAATEKFRKTDFAGGTLVEYANAFSIEFSRGTVTRFSIDGNRLFIATDGKAMFSYPDLSELRIEKRNGAFLIYGDYCSCYALAPKGVEIPKRPTLEELRDAVEVLAGEHE